MYDSCTFLVYLAVVVVIVVCIFRYFHLYLQKSFEKIKKREEAEPQGQALAKRTCRGGAKRTNKKMSLERRGTQCKLEAGGHIGKVTIRA